MPTEVISGYAWTLRRFTRLTFKRLRSQSRSSNRSCLTSPTRSPYTARSKRIARPRISCGRSVSTLLIKRSTSLHGGPMGRDSSEYTRGPETLSARCLQHQPRSSAKRTNDRSALRRLLMVRRQQPSPAKCAMYRSKSETARSYKRRLALYQTRNLLAHRSQYEMVESQNPRSDVIQMQYASRCSYHGSGSAGISHQPR